CLRTLAPYCLLLTFFLAPALLAQDSGDAERITDRLRALQREAQRLAGESRTLVGDLRQREIDRDIKAAQLKQAEAAMAEAETAIQSTTMRLSDLEVQRINQLPDLKTQLVDIYKRGRSGYARMLFSAGDLREFARATRAVSALSAINERRIEEHRKTVDAMLQERAAFEQKAKELQAKTAEARRAKSAADGAVASASELIRQIDSRRDMTAQYVGELQDAYGKLQQQVTALSTEKPAGAEPVAVPLRPFQGTLDWPVQGRIIGFFGQPSNRLGGGAVRNGIEIAADEDTPVRAIHGGSVGFAGPFTGFGTLVILDHGGNGYSLYGYLASTALEQGQTVETGAEVGRVGLAPAGPPTLYFEMRIDGRSVNPVQWLKPR
ncbi:MAG TPA: peptidoglycan DD-metalloendopeptidase family protein, partial [Vicinamibacterales bacterium]|nr:peptidoglycan DD-metalloendopeptidase family protein [Vicinamibacterales bacterium]